jgi:hypothetical protein
VNFFFVKMHATWVSKDGLDTVCMTLCGCQSCTKLRLWAKVRQNVAAKKYDKQITRHIFMPKFGKKMTLWDVECVANKVWQAMIIAWIRKMSMSSLLVATKSKQSACIRTNECSSSSSWVEDGNRNNQLLALLWESLKDLKRGRFLSSYCVIKKRRAVGSHIDGSNHSHTTDNGHTRPTICLGGTHVRGPRGFMIYLCGTHTFWFVGPTILLSEVSFSNKPKPWGIFAPPLPHLQQNFGRRITRGWFTTIQEVRARQFKKNLTIYRN